MKRIDADVIKGITEEFGLKVAKHFQSFPLIYVSQQDMIEVEKWAETLPQDTHVGFEVPQMYDFKSWFPFNNFIFMLESDSVPYYLYFHQGVPEENEIVTNAFLSDRKENSSFMSITCLTWPCKSEIGWQVGCLGSACTFEDSTIIRYCELEILGKKMFSPDWYEYLQEKVDYVFHGEKTLPNLVISQTKTLMAKLWCLLIWVKESDAYPVTISPTKKKPTSNETLKKPWRNPNLSTIRFLNKRPSKPSEGTKGDAPGTPRRSHWRRAHRKTLTNPRYRNHPLYQVKDAILVKPSWVGPEVFEYEANTYRVWKPNEAGEYDKPEGF